MSESFSFFSQRPSDTKGFVSLLGQMSCIFPRRFEMKTHPSWNIALHSISRYLKSRNSFDARIPETKEGGRMAKDEFQFSFCQKKQRPNDLQLPSFKRTKAEAFWKLFVHQKAINGFHPPDEGQKEKKTRLPKKKQIFLQSMKILFSLFFPRKDATSVPFPHRKIESGESIESKNHNGKTSLRSPLLRIRSTSNFLWRPKERYSSI